MATPAALALAKAIQEIEREMLPVVQNEMWGDITFELHVERGKVLKIVRTVKKSIKIEGNA